MASNQRQLQTAATLSSPRPGQQVGSTKSRVLDRGWSAQSRIWH
jgi:hypothetical protein